MANPVLPNNRQSWWPTVSDNPTAEETALHFRLLYNATNDHDKALVKLATTGTVTAPTSTITRVVSTGTGTAGPPGPPGPPGTGAPPGLGGINNQSGNASYITAMTDNGILLVVNRAGGTTVTLNSGVTTPFFLFATNLGTTGTATFTPSSGLVNGAASFALTPLKTAIIAFDGTNWIASVLPVVVDFQTNGVDNASQSKLNFIQGSNVTITDGGAGNITIAASTTAATSYTVRIKTANYTAVADDAVFCNTTGGGFSITLPAASANSGAVIIVKKTSLDSNVLTLAPTGGDLIEDAASQTFLPLQTFQLVSDGVSNWWSI